MFNIILILSIVGLSTSAFSKSLTCEFGRENFFKREVIQVVEAEREGFKISVTKKLHTEAEYYEAFKGLPAWTEASAKSAAQYYASKPPIVTESLGLCSQMQTCSLAKLNGPNILSCSSQIANGKQVKFSLYYNSASDEYLALCEIYGREAEALLFNLLGLKPARDCTVQ